MSPPDHSPRHCHDPQHLTINTPGVRGRPHRTIAHHARPPEHKNKRLSPFTQRQREETRACVLVHAHEKSSEWFSWRLEIAQWCNKETRVSKSSTGSHLPNSQNWKVDREERKKNGCIAQDMDFLWQEQAVRLLDRRVIRNAESDQLLRGVREVWPGGHI